MEMGVPRIKALRLRGCCVQLREILFGEATMTSEEAHADPVGK
jgi:hypothetical protein